MAVQDGTKILVAGLSPEAFLGVSYAKHSFHWKSGWKLSNQKK